MQLYTQTTEHKSCTAAHSPHCRTTAPHNSTSKLGHTNAAQQHSAHYSALARHSNTLTLQRRSPTHTAPQAALTNPTLQLPARAEEITIHFQDPFSIDQFCLYNVWKRRRQPIFSLAFCDICCFKGALGERDANLYKAISLQWLFTQPASRGAEECTLPQVC